MAQLKKEFEAWAEDVETFIASGNVIFSSRSTDRAALEKKIEARLKKSLGYESRPSSGPTRKSLRGGVSGVQGGARQDRALVQRRVHQRAARSARRAR